LQGKAIALASALLKEHAEREYVCFSRPGPRTHGSDSTNFNRKNTAILHSYSENKGLVVKGS
jgi:hypothetical protein